MTSIIKEKCPRCGDEIWGSSPASLRSQRYYHNKKKCKKPKEEIITPFIVEKFEKLETRINVLEQEMKKVDDFATLVLGVYTSVFNTSSGTTRDELMKDYTFYQRLKAGFIEAHKEEIEENEKRKEEERKKREEEEAKKKQEKEELDKQIKELVSKKAKLTCDDEEKDHLTKSIIKDCQDCLRTYRVDFTKALMEKNRRMRDVIQMECLKKMNSCLSDYREYDPKNWLDESANLIKGIELIVKEDYCRQNKLPIVYEVIHRIKVKKQEENDNFETQVTLDLKDKFTHHKD